MAVWERVAEHAQFCPRDTTEGVVFQDRLWVSNAYTIDESKTAESGERDVLVRDLWSSADGVTWRCELEHTPYDGYADLVAWQGALFAVGNTVWRSEDGRSWAQVAAETPMGLRGYGEILEFKGALWQVGGGRDVWRSADAVSWECAKSEVPWGDRYASAVAACGGALWLLGGSTLNGPAASPPEAGYADQTTFNDVWRSEDGVEWACVCERAPWQQRMWFRAAGVADQLYVFGGYSNLHKRNLGDVWSTKNGVAWEMHTDVGTPGEHSRPGAGPCWSRKCGSPSASPLSSEAAACAARHEPICVVWEGCVWIVAGNANRYDGSLDKLQNDVWRLRPSTPRL